MKATPVMCLKVMPRDYKCSQCGHEQLVSTNHTDSCLSYCKNCSWKMFAYDGVHMLGSMHRQFIYNGEDPTPAELNTYAWAQEDIDFYGALYHAKHH